MIIINVNASGIVTDLHEEADDYTPQTSEHEITGQTPGAVPLLRFPTAISAGLAAWDGQNIVVNQPAKYAALKALTATDTELSRTEEDIIDTAIAKGSYALSDLPAATQARYAAKKAARAAYLASEG